MGLYRRWASPQGSFLDEGKSWQVDTLASTDEGRGDHVPNRMHHTWETALEHLDVLEAGSLQG